MYMHRVITIENKKKKTKRGINIFDSGHNYNFTSNKILELFNNGPIFKKYDFHKIPIYFFLAKYKNIFKPK